MTAPRTRLPRVSAVLGRPEIGAIVEDGVVLDLHTISPEQDADLVVAVRTVQR